MQLNVMIKLRKATISLSKHEHCMFQSQLMRCFVYCLYRGNYISAIPKAPPAGREWIYIFNRPVCYFGSDQKENRPIFLGSKQADL